MIKKLVKRLYEFYFSREIKDELSDKYCLACDIIAFHTELQNVKTEDELNEILHGQLHLVQDEIRSCFKKYFEETK